MPPAGPQYTLVGFSPELDWRPLTFLKPIPANRVCSACGLVRKTSALLPCMHVLCEPCHQQCVQDGSQVCPLDGNGYGMEDVHMMECPADELLRREVKCWNEDSGCQYATAASGITQHFLLECEHHSVRCLKCSATVLCREVCSHLASPSCDSSKTLASESDAPSSKLDEGALLTSLKGAFERQADELSTFLRPMAADIRAHGDILREISGGISTLKETIRTQLSVSTRQNSDSARKSTLVTVAPEEELKESCPSGSDGFGSFSRSFSTLQKTLKYGLRKTRDGLSQVAAPITQMDADVNENSEKGLDRVLLRLVEPQEERCVEFFVNDVKSLQDIATKEGWAAHDSEQVYLRGYCMSPGILLIKSGESATLHARYALHKGDMDDFVQWPFEHKMRMSVIHPQGRAELVLECKPCGRQERHQKPREPSNCIGYIPGSFDLSDLIKDGYVENDRLRVKWELLA
ncbi:uncharacterized protein LOC144104382 isoform X1 [Amblyomma americanum]